MTLFIRFTFVIMSFIFIAPSIGNTAKIKVLKIKGNSALIESSEPLTPGESYFLQEEPLSQKVSFNQAPGFKSRKNSIMLGGSFTTLKSDTVQDTRAALQGRYGWNFVNLEAGLIFEAEMINTGPGAITDLLGGGYFDYNLVPNRDPHSLIYGLLGLASGGVKLFADGGSTNLLKLDLGAFSTWFLKDSSAAIRLEAFAGYQQVDSANAQTSLLGGGLRGFFVYYF